MPCWCLSSFPTPTCKLICIQQGRLQVIDRSNLLYFWVLRMSTSALVAEKVWKDIESTHSVSDEQLSILHFLFGKNLERAMRIVDQRGVKRILGEPSGRSIFQVVGESKRKEEYVCFAQHYCACYSFFYDIVNRGEQLCCKHQLAARLASSLGVCIDVKMSDDHLALMLSLL